MHRRTWARPLAMVLFVGTVCGCKTPATSDHPPDPLLLSKKPVEGAGSTGAPQTLVAVAEPTMPALPAIVLAARPAPRAPSPPEKPLHLPETPPIANRPSPSVDAVPTARTASGGSVTATPAVRRTVPGNFGHAPDYSWLEGVLDKHYPNQLLFRYADPAAEDAYGGRVRLDDDARLARFQDGDVLHIEGVLLPQVETQAPDGWALYPRFRIRDVRLARPQK